MSAPSIPESAVEAVKANLRAEVAALPEAEAAAREAAACRAEAKLRAEMKSPTSPVRGTVEVVELSKPLYDRAMRIVAAMKAKHGAKGDFSTVARAGLRLAWIKRGCEWLGVR